MRINEKDFESRAIEDNILSARRVTADACIDVIFQYVAFLGWKDPHLAF
jgi:hypothetical protein